MNSEEMKLKSQVHSAYFHYHHDEVQYWGLVMSQFTQPEQTQQINTELPPLNTDQPTKPR